MFNVGAGHHQKVINSLVEKQEVQFVHCAIKSPHDILPTTVTLNHLKDKLWRCLANWEICDE